MAVSTTTRQALPDLTPIDADQIIDLAAKFAMEGKQHLKFARYEEKSDGTKPTLAELIELQTTDGDLFANLERSGCESCYVEVARWNGSKQQWQRYAFAKMLDVGIQDSAGDWLDLDEQEVGKAIVEAINRPVGLCGGFVHSLPNYGD